jgi:alpha-tubulin suppressor-like RCC1 family protein
MVKLNYFESKRLKIKKIAAGARHTLVITNDNQLYSFGDNSEGQCTGENECYFIPKKIKFPNGDRVKDVYAGYNHSVAITLLGDVYTWGDTSHSKLGYSTKKSMQNVPKIIPFMKDKEIFQIFTGPMHTALVTDCSDGDKKTPKLTNIVHDNYGAITEETSV